MPSIPSPSLPPNMRSFLIPRIAWVLLGATAASLPAQVPQLLNYQGRVRVSGADFTGTGQFKFAMVSSTGAASYWSNDGTSTGGSQPAAAVSLTVQAGLYQVLLGDATLPNMTVLPPSVFNNSDASLRVWFSDGVNGWQQLTPDQRVAAVGYAMMADNVKNGAVTSAKLGDGAVTSAKLAPGAVTSTALAPTAITDSLAAGGQGTVPSGAGLFSTQQNAPALLSAGYTATGTINAGDVWASLAGGAARLNMGYVWTGTELLIWGYGTEGWRYNPSTNLFTPMSTSGQPVVRQLPFCVWTGTEMIVWGGWISDGNLPVSGGRYHPATDTWTTLSTTNAPTGRYWGSAVWTGTEMIVWGGFNGSGSAGGGAKYTPNGASGTWTTLTTTNAPAVRWFHTAVWSGSEMLLFGGRDNAQAYNNGSRFNPAGTGTWNTMSDGPGARSFHTAVWTGTEMIVWGGNPASGALPWGTGAKYAPGTNSWTALPTADAPMPRTQHAAVWTGQDMVIWGGTTSAAAGNSDYINSGSRYYAATNTWTGLTMQNAPSARSHPAAVWTGTEMVIWGGTNGGPLATGGRYRTGQTLYLYQRP